MDKKWKSTPKQNNEGTKGGEKKNKRSLISHCEEEEEDLDKLFAGVKERKRSKKSNGEETEDNEEAKDEDKSRQSKDKKLKKKKQDSISTSDLEGGALPYGVLKSNIVQIVNPEAPVERVDPETGYRVYKAHLLKVGEGGGTPLCPFDCSCCF